LPDAVVIVEVPVPLSAHAALYVVLTLLLIAILWAVFGSMDRIVVAPGKVATRTPLGVMQPFSTSCILQINVWVPREAETLLTLVPDGADLYIEAHMPSPDAGYVKVGDEVRVKLDAYPFQRFGILNGVLDVISADSVPQKRTMTSLNSLPAAGTDHH
jgi:hypothetical protein